MSASRIEPVVPGTRPELAVLEARIAAARGRISPLYQVLLNSPAVVEGWVRERPEQGLWGHRRWRPDHAPAERRKPRPPGSL